MPHIDDTVESQVLFQQHTEQFENQSLVLVRKSTIEYESKISKLTKEIEDLPKFTSNQKRNLDRLRTTSGVLALVGLTCVLVGIFMANPPIVLGIVGGGLLIAGAMGVFGTDWALSLHNSRVRGEETIKQLEKNKNDLQEGQQLATGVTLDQNSAMVTTHVLDTSPKKDEKSVQTLKGTVSGKENKKLRRMRS